MKKFSIQSGFFFKENVRYPIWTCRDPISLILGTRFSLILETRWWFSLILGTRFSILGTRIGFRKHRFSTCSVRSPRAPREKPRRSARENSGLRELFVSNLTNDFNWTAIWTFFKYKAENASESLNKALPIYSGTSIGKSQCVFFVFIFRNLLWGSVNYGQSLHGLHNTKSLRTPALKHL